MGVCIDNYQCLDEIGEGGQAQLILAYDNQNNQRVALKVFKH